MEWIWLVWIGLAIVFAVIEIFTLDLLFLMLAIGSLGGMLTGFIAPELWWLQLLVAAIIAVVLLFALRPPLLRRLRRGGSDARHNIDAIAGILGVVETGAAGVPATVKLANGETWSATPRHDAAPLSPGERVRVVRVIGATVEVEPASKGS